MIGNMTEHMECKLEKFYSLWWDGTQRLQNSVLA